jgi:tetratricopeptide (TPR) repeat protein
MINTAENISQNFIQERPLEYVLNLNAKGLLLCDLREYVKAEACYRKALEVAQQQEGDCHIEGLWSFNHMSYCLMGNLARCLGEAGRYTESSVLYDQTLSLGEKILPKAHPYFLLYQIEKGRLICLQGDHQKALKMIRKAVDDYFKFGGEEYGELANAWNAMGQSYLQLKDYKNAEQMFKRARKCGLKYLGKEMPIVMRACHGIGWTYLNQKRPKKGLSSLFKALKTCAGYGIAPDNMIPLFEEFQKALLKAESFNKNRTDIKQIALQASKLSQSILGQNHPLTIYFQNRGTSKLNSPP